MNANQSPNKKSFAIGESVEVIADCALKGTRGTVHTAKGGKDWAIYSLKTATGYCGHFRFEELTLIDSRTHCQA